MNLRIAIVCAHEAGNFTGKAVHGGHDRLVFGGQAIGCDDGLVNAPAPMALACGDLPDNALGGRIHPGVGGSGSIGRRRFCNLILLCGREAWVGKLAGNRMPGIAVELIAFDAIGSIAVRRPEFIDRIFLGSSTERPDMSDAPVRVIVDIVGSN